MTDAAATPSLVAKSSHRTMPASVLLFILVVLPFLPALHGQFTWDDDLLLANSAQVRAWNGLHLIWNPFVQPIQYFPLTYTTFWLEHKIWGLNTTGYHLVNMLLQGGCAVMLWLALRRLGIRAAWFAALLWAIHPVQVDSVAWISERKNTLSGIFYMLAAWSYLRFERIGDPSPNHSTASPDAADFIGIEASAPYRRNWMFYGLAFAAFIAAMLSKTLVCTFPAGMLIVLWWKREKLSWRDVAPLIPLLVAALALAAITALQEHSNMTVGGSSNLVFSPLQRIIIAGKNIWFYLLTLIVPYPLMPIYPRWTYDSTYLLNYVPAAGTLLLLAVFFIARKKIGKWPLAGFLFFLVTLSPLLGFMNFFTMHYSFVADHYQYLATLGVLVPLAELLRRLGQSVAG